MAPNFLRLTRLTDLEYRCPSDERERRRSRVTGHRVTETPAESTTSCGIVTVRCARRRVLLSGHQCRLGHGIRRAAHGAARARGGLRRGERSAARLARRRSPTRRVAPSRARRVHGAPARAPAAVVGELPVAQCGSVVVGGLRTLW